MNHHQPGQRAPLSIRLWIVLCAALHGWGWLLSALGQLARPGYMFALALTAVGFYLAYRQETSSRRNFSKLRRRFSRFFPLGFLILASLAALGGLLYAPNNFDALAYRTPRVLHWLSAGRWHWIETYHGWLNVRSCGFEWITAPFLLFGKTDHGNFLLNLASFLLLPGLVFSFLTRMGIRKRLAWNWMWLFPTGFCFVMQSGSVGNDLYGAVIALASIDFALRARASQRASDLYYGCVAVALTTAAKSTNLVLLLPWLIAVFPALRLLRRKIWLSASLGILSLSCSFLPTALLNQHYIGDWTGLRIESAWMRPPSALVCFVHNLALLTIQNFAPPFCPFAGLGNQTLDKLVPEIWKQTLDSFAEYGRKSYRLRELPTEEEAGIGFGLSVLILAQIIAWLGCKKKSGRAWIHEMTRDKWRLLLLLSPFLSAAVYMSKSGIACPSRILAPFYAPMLPAFLLLAGQVPFLHRRWWRALAWLSFGWAALALVLTPARPLWPALTVLKWMEIHRPSPALERATTVYRVYRERSDVFRPVRELLPPNVSVLGVVGNAFPEACLWRPFGATRVHHILRNTTMEVLRQRGINWVVIFPSDAPRVLGMPLTEWLAQMHSEVVTNLQVKVLAGNDPFDIVIARLDPASMRR